MTSDRLAGRLAAAMEEPEPWWTEERFDDLAIELFRRQFDTIPAYQRLCSSRGITPGRVAHWEEIPAIPTTAFKEMELFGGDEVAHLFTTSGTTGGEGNRGTARFSQANLDLMERSVLVNAKRALFPDIHRIHILALAPPPTLVPHMIMAWGMARLISHFGTEESDFLVGTEGLDVPGLVDRLAEFTRRNEPVTIIGATFGFVNLIKGLSAKGVSFKLPKGTRTMDAGGNKGLSEVWSREKLEGGLISVFGVEPGHMVNLLGMTELASQIYDDTLRSTVAGDVPQRCKIPPPWVRTRVVDPISLHQLPPGDEGVLVYLDLANLDTPAAVLTDDLGVIRGTGFQILGRLKDDGGRGCSLTIDEMTRRTH